MRKISILLMITLLLIISISFSYNIVTSIKPLYLIIKGEVGDNCNVSYIMSPYANPHTFQLKSSDLIKFQKADLIVLVGNNFESWSDKIYQKFQDKTLELDKTILSSQIKQNPHFWTDPVYVDYFSDIVFDRLDKNIQNKSKSTYINFKKSLLNLSNKILQLCKHIDNNYFIAVHPAFYYIFKRYGFEVRSLISGGESSVSSRKIIELIKYSNEHKLKKIFAVKGLDTKIANPLISSTHLQLINVDFLSANSNNYVDYLNNIAMMLFGEN